MKRLGRFVGCLLFAAVSLIATAWAFGAVWFDGPFGEANKIMATLVALAFAIALLFVRPLWRKLGAFAILLAGVIGWWLTISPRQDRDWKVDVAVLPDTAIEGERVTIHNVRNFNYRTETDFTPRYDTRTFDLSQLLGLDLFLTYWGSPLIAHPIVSFDFGHQGRICFSIETRPKRGEAYSTIGGFYRQFELIYVAADERDAIRVRTNFRKDEDVYLYHLNLPMEEARGRFFEYVRRINDLHARPEWYNAVTSNCTTNIRTQHIAAENMPWDWRILVNGKGDELLYERGVIDHSVPFAEVKRRAHINARAQVANDAPDFSERIRTPKDAIEPAARGLEEK